MNEKTLTDKKTVCICCGSDMKTTPYKDNFLNNDLMQCTNCSHIQLKTIPGPSEILSYYENTYSNKRSNSQWNVYFKTMRLRAAAQTEYILKYVDIDKSDHVLDMGCGYGYLVKELTQYSDHVMGLEFDDRCVEYCQEQGWPVQKIRSENEMGDHGSKKLITMSHVLEHLTQMNAFIDILKKNADYTFIEVPYYEESCKGQWNDQLGHINFFNERSLRLLFENNGFEVLDLHRCGPSMNFHWGETWQFVKRKTRGLPFLKDFDYFYGMYRKPNSKGIWLRCLVKSKNNNF